MNKQQAATDIIVEVAKRIRPTQTIGWEDEPTGFLALHALEDLLEMWIENELDDKVFVRDSYLELERMRETLQQCYNSLMGLVTQLEHVTKIAECVKLHIRRDDASLADVIEAIRVAAEVEKGRGGEGEGGG